MLKIIFVFYCYIVVHFMHRDFYGFLHLHCAARANEKKFNYNHTIRNSITWSFIPLQVSYSIIVAHSFVLLDILMDTSVNRAASIPNWLQFWMDQKSMQLFCCNFRFSDSLDRCVFFYLKIDSKMRYSGKIKWIIKTDVSLDFIINSTIHIPNGDELRESASEFGQMCDDRSVVEYAVATCT